MSRPTSSPRHAAAVFSLGLLAMGLACDTEAPQGQGAPSAQPTAPAPMAAPAPAPAESEAPRTTIQTSGRYVTRGSHENQAVAQEFQEVEYQWTMQGGVVTDGADTPTATYSVDEDASIVRLFCRLKDAKGQVSTAVAGQVAVALPILEDFKSTPAVITAGNQGVLGWNAREVKSLTLDPGAIDVTKTGSIPIQIKETTTYTLTGVNFAGTAVSRQVTVKVVPAPEILSFGAVGIIQAGQPIKLKAEFAHGKAEIKQGETLLASSEQSPLEAQAVAANTTTVTLTVTNEGGATVTQSRTFQRPGY